MSVSDVRKGHMSTKAYHKESGCCLGEMKVGGEKGTRVTKKAPGDWEQGSVLQDFPRTSLGLPLPRMHADKSLRAKKDGPPWQG